MRTAQTRACSTPTRLSMLEGVLQVADLQVRDIMVPRAQMIARAPRRRAARILPTVVESGHSRFPVMEADSDDIVGILLAKDLLRIDASRARGEQLRHQRLLRPAVFVPESKRVNVLLKEFRRSRNHMAIVVDEYGGVAGLVTIEDVIEQIVGEIDDEYDVEDETNIRSEGERQLPVRGVTRIDEFNEYFSADFPTMTSTPSPASSCSSSAACRAAARRVMLGLRVPRHACRPPAHRGLRVTVPLPPPDEDAADDAAANAQRRGSTTAASPDPAVEPMRLNRWSARAAALGAGVALTLRVRAALLVVARAALGRACCCGCGAMRRRRARRRGSASCSRPVHSPRHLLAVHQHPHASGRHRCGSRCS